MTETPDQGSSSKAVWMLVIVTVLWGLSFPLMKNWMDASESCPGGKGLATFTLIGLRMFSAVILLSIFQPRLALRPTSKEIGIGMMIGFTFFFGFSLQVIGLAWTTPARSAFITSLG